MALLETPARLEPCQLPSYSEKLADVISAVAARATTLGARLHPLTAASLTDLVRVMNCYYSNLIEGRFCQLQFVRHDCYGEDCLGAIFSDAKEAEAFNSALITDGRPVAADIERLALLGNARCHAPPTSEPFEIARAPCR
jgi:hypothetical protein